MATAFVEQPIMPGRPSREVLTLKTPEVIAAEEENAIRDLTGAIVTRLSKLAADQVQAKTDIEQRWIRNVRAFHGYYDPQTEKSLKEKRQSKAYVKMTRAKTVALEAKLFDLIFPTDDRNWGISATPVPKLTREQRDASANAAAAAEQANQAEAQGQSEQANAIAMQGDDEAARAHAANTEIQRARAASDLMQEEMDDQLIESSYPQESRDMIHDACMLGTGILKGPLVNQGARGRWVVADDGTATLEQGNDPRPKVKRVDPWSFFPDMSARRIDEAEFTFERYLWSGKDLRKMVRTHGFNPDAVRRILNDGNPSRVTTAPGLTYLAELRGIVGEGSTVIKGRYVGWEYHGPLECDEVVALLKATGQPDLAAIYQEKRDPLNEFNVIIYFCENEILKIAPEHPLDSGETLYSVYNIEESEASIFGYGIPEIMADTASAFNSSWRMALDNGALSVGPQVIIEKDAIVPQDGVWTLSPRKIWLRIKAALANQSAPMEFVNVPNNMNEIAAIIKLASEFMDIETGIPMPQQGEQGTHTTQTVGGMAILQSAANIIFRRMVKNYDDGIITPTMRRLYDWNMQHSNRKEIKGDMSVDARGTSVLLVREVQAQNLIFAVMQLVSNPNFAPMMKPYEAVRKLFQAMMISPDDVMETKEDYQENVKKAAEASQGQQDPATINAQARIQAAQIAAKSREVSDNMTLMVAQMRERAALFELQAKGEITAAELQTRLAETQAKLDSAERMMAAEIGAERINSQEARARGEEPTGSGGYISSGTVKAEGNGGQ